jgi:hypothetical protein
VFKGKKCICAKGTGGQTVLNLWETEELTEFHDAELAQATKEINAIFERVQKNNRDPNRTASLIEFKNRHLMVWASYGHVTPFDDDETIIKAFKLKAKK